jgi:hypothetical protein
MTEQICVRYKVGLGKCIDQHSLGMWENCEKFHSSMAVLIFVDVSVLISTITIKPSKLTSYFTLFVHFRTNVAYLAIMSQNFIVQ